LELLESKPDTDVLILKNRKGFVKLALENGVDLVPVYGYGITDLYIQKLQIQWFKEARKWFVRKTQVAPTFGVGRQWMHMFPLRRKLPILVGSPIPVEKVENPTQQQIDHLHQKYVEELCKMVEEYSVTLGEKRKIEVI